MSRLPGTAADFDDPDDEPVPIEQIGQAVRGAMQAWLTAITRCHSVCSDRRAVSASSESHRALSGQSTLRFRDVLTAEVCNIAYPFAPSQPFRSC